MLIKQHWLECAKKIYSPNHNERPNEQDISLIVIHCISLPPGKFGNTFIDDLFCNQLDPEQHSYFKNIYQLQVSAHILIKRTGEIHQYVPFNKRAWHAGLSEYQGRRACNDFSIGIELEGTESSPYHNIQYLQLAALIESLLASYPSLSKQHITGHSNIAPGRKKDPGNYFDWEKLDNLLY